MHKKNQIHGSGTYHKESLKLFFNNLVMNNKYVSIILFTLFLKHILNGIYVLYFQVFPFKPNMILLICISFILSVKNTIFII